MWELTETAASHVLLDLSFQRLSLLTEFPWKNASTYLNLIISCCKLDSPVNKLIGHVRYINILTWLRGFQVKLLYLVWFFLYPSLFWELRDKRNMKNLQFWPEIVGAMRQPALFKMTHNQFRPSIWFRYVDDTFSLFDSKDTASSFLDFLNSRHPNIKFTMELEENREIPFFGCLYQAWPQHIFNYYTP